MTEFSRRLKDVVTCFDQLQQTDIAVKIEVAISLIVPSLRVNKPLLLCGNGGSASDAEHISGELVGRFLLERRALNVICLSANTAIITALGNDYDNEIIFARQVEAHGNNGGVCYSVYQQVAIQKYYYSPRYGKAVRVNHDWHDRRRRWSHGSTL